MNQMRRLHLWNLGFLVVMASSFTACRDVAGPEAKATSDVDITITVSGPAQVTPAGVINLSSCPGAVNNFAILNVGNVPDSVQITFTSDNTSLVTVDSNGRVQAVTNANGTAVITTAPKGGRAVSTIVNVGCNNPPQNGPVLGSLELVPHSASQLVGTTLQLSVICKDTTGALMQCPALYFYSNLNEHVTVNPATGLLTFVGAGTSTVCVQPSQTVSNPKDCGTYTATIVNAPTVSVGPVIDVTNCTGFVRTHQLTATVNGVNAAIISASSSNTSVATVSSTGLVTLTGVGGDAVITAGTSSGSATAQVHVGQCQQVPRGWHILPANGTGLGLSCTNGVASGTQQFRVVYDDNGADVPANLVTWSGITGGSFNTSTGVLSYNIAGNYSVSATVGGQTQTVSGPITGACQQPTIVITPQNPHITLTSNGGTCSATQQFGAALSNGQSISGIWTSPGGTFSLTGLFTGLIAGVYQVLFTANDGSGRTGTTQVFVEGQCQQASNIVVTVTPSTFTCQPGGSQPVVAVVTGTTNGQSISVLWSIVSGDATAITLSNTNSNTVVAQCAHAGTATLRATAVADQSKFGQSVGVVNAAAVCTFTPDVTLQSDGSFDMTVGQQVHLTITSTSPLCQLPPWSSNRIDIAAITSSDASFSFPDPNAPNGQRLYPVGLHATLTAIGPGTAIIGAQGSITDMTTLFQRTVRVH